MTITSDKPDTLLGKTRKSLAARVGALVILGVWEVILGVTAAGHRVIMTVMAVEVVGLAGIAIMIVLRVPGLIVLKNLVILQVAA